MKVIKGNRLGENFFEPKTFQEILIVKKILADVKKDGDEAVRKYAGKFDKMKMSDFEISKEKIKESYREVGEETTSALKKAARNIRQFAEKQFSTFKDFETIENGVRLGQRIVPIEIVGCYVPGGRYPLPSSALMTVIPARVAGVNNIFVCSPKITPVTIVAADIAGADRIFNIGGVQAIGAMAYGTKSIPKVDKIVGPGNNYVTAAKKEVYGAVGIDFLAGPSEILVIADETANPEFIAADLLAQAEHDSSAIPNLITTSRKIAKEVNKQIEAQLVSLDTRKTAELSLNNGRIIITDNLEEAADIANRLASEHVELQVKNPEQISIKLKNYGSMFIGKYSAEVFGDYCSGTNHTLPTNGASRYTGGLSVKDFVKILTYQEIGGNSVGELIVVASRIAEIEGLCAHKKSAEKREIKITTKPNNNKVI